MEGRLAAVFQQPQSLDKGDMAEMPADRAEVGVDLGSGQGVVKARDVGQGGRPRRGEAGDEVVLPFSARGFG